MGEGEFGALEHDEGVNAVAVDEHVLSYEPWTVEGKNAVAGAVPDLGVVYFQCRAGKREVARFDVNACRSVFDLRVADRRRACAVEVNAVVLSGYFIVSRLEPVALEGDFISFTGSSVNVQGSAVDVQEAHFVHIDVCSGLNVEGLPFEHACSTVNHVGLVVWPCAEIRIVVMEISILSPDGELDVLVFAVCAEADRIFDDHREQAVVGVQRYFHEAEEAVAAFDLEF